MIYLLRVVNQSIEIAACENGKHVPKRIAQGYRKVTRTRYIAKWRERDLLATVEAIARVPRVELAEQAVGGGYVPNGFKLYHVKKGE